jgi:hypothetical protein
VVEEDFMTDLNIQLDPAAVPMRPNWGAIWAGVFTFVAIWSVFGALCLAIFASSASLSLALSVWGVILTIVAMFFAGRTTGQLAGVSNPSESLMHAMVMFGLAVISTLVALAVGGSVFAGGAVHSSYASYAIGVFSSFGWALFVGLFLGWLAAIGGASSAHKKLGHAETMQHQVRHA